MQRSDGWVITRGDIDTSPLPDVLDWFPASVVQQNLSKDSLNDWSAGQQEERIKETNLLSKELPVSPGILFNDPRIGDARPRKFLEIDACESTQETLDLFWLQPPRRHPIV